MATKAAAAATSAAAKAGPNFKVGKTKVFLPNHIIKMLPPTRIFSPYFATFEVPLRFNKLDLRDYLYHAYGVEVRGVRSWITPQMPRRKGSDKTRGEHDSKLTQLDPGRWYRPQPIKRMMVELVKPFAFPQPPPKPTDDQIGTENDPRKDWDYEMHRRMLQQTEIYKKTQRARVVEQKFALQSEQPHVPSFRVELAQQARELVSGEREWKNGVELDERWEAIQDAEDADAGKPRK